MKIPLNRSKPFSRRSLLRLLAVSLTAASLSIRAGDFAVERFKRIPFVMAHRACWGPDIPENSLRGIQLCLKKGVDMIEVDVHRSRDGVLVLLHDDTLDRTTNLTGSVEERSYEVLSAAHMRVGLGGADAPLSSDPVPTLEAALRAVRGKAILFLDIKNPRDRQDVLDLVTREQARDYVALYAFFPNDRQAYGRLPQWVQRHSIVPIAEDATFEDRRELWRPSIAAAAHYYGDFHPLALMVFFKNIRFIADKPNNLRVPLMVAPIYGLAGERDEGFDPRSHSDPNFMWGDLIKAGATAFMTNHPLQLLEYVQH